MIHTPTVEPAIGTGEETAAEPRQFVAFRLGSVLMGVDILRACEIVRAREIVTVAQSPPEVLGALNLRGRIVTVLEPRAILGVEEPPPPDENGATCIILDGPDEPIGIRVDSLGDVIPVPPSRIEPPPANIRSIHARHLLGTVRLASGILLLLDPDALF